jgi:hypothetical protein
MASGVAIDAGLFTLIPGGANGDEGNAISKSTPGPEPAPGN